MNKFKYKILKYWNDSDDLYVNYIVLDEEKNTKANCIAYYNTSDIGCDYNSSYPSEIENSLLELIKQNNGCEFNHPKVSELSTLLKYVYDYVCESEANMCHIDKDDWKNLMIENNFTNVDLEILKSEIKKYDLEDYITVGDDGYVICGYGCLQTKFNDDRVKESYNLER